jgi:hypothetical protein
MEIMSRSGISQVYLQDVKPELAQTGVITLLMTDMFDGI